MTTLSTDDLVRLRECPFCGAEAQDATDGPYFIVRCTNCEAEQVSSVRRIARSAWNTRAPDPELIRLRGEVEVMGWRPIESAPRDGTPILTYSEGCTETESHLVMWWSNERAERRGFGWEAYEVSHLLAPSFWMPLPAAPTTGESHEK